MQTTNLQKSDCQRPSITDVISQYVTLRKSGREFWALCPFHEEKTPSFAVNEEKGVFHCHGCGAGGDAITFVQTIEGIDFKTAAKRLGISSSNRPPVKITSQGRLTAGEIGAAWANEQSTKLNCMIAEWLEVRDAADSVALFDVAEILDRELVMLRGFYDSLTYAAGVAELLAVRESIENITDGAEMSL